MSWAKVWSKSHRVEDVVLAAIFTFLAGCGGYGLYVLVSMGVLA